VNPSENSGFIDWDWLTKQKPIEDMEFTKHLKFNQPVIVKINGSKNKGIILKPGI
jgi:hypothetical protein